MIGRLKHLLHLERRDAASDAIERLLGLAAGTASGGPVDATATAAAESCIRAISAPFALAGVSGPPAVSPGLLVGMARAL